MLNIHSSLGHSASQRNACVDQAKSGLASRIDDARNRIRTLIERASSAADKLSGPIPEAAGAPSSLPANSIAGSVEGLHDDLAKLEGHLSRIDSAI